MDAKRQPVVLAAVDDLFFWVRIEAVARGLGVTLVQARDAAELEAHLSVLSPDLIILDLNSEACSPLEALRRIKGDRGFESTPVVAFLSHVQVELERAAREAGCESVMPRSTFSRKLPQILQMLG